MQILTTLGLSLSLIAVAYLAWTFLIKLPYDLAMVLAKHWRND